MNKKVIAIAIVTLLALIVLTLFSFGPLSSIRKKSGINPESLKPAQQPSVQMIDFKEYKNIDVKENHYQISIPKDWQVAADSVPGGYAVNFSGGRGEIHLMDVPDNTTLELYVLSQEEPRLRRSVTGYHRWDYQKLAVNGNEGYELVYSGEENQNTTKTVTAYIGGQDHAGVISLSVTLDNFSNLRLTFDKVINSFNWQNK